MKRIGIEIDNDTKCMVITLITKLITIPTQSSQEIYDAFVEQVSCTSMDYTPQLPTQLNVIVQIFSFMYLSQQK